MLSFSVMLFMMILSFALSRWAIYSEHEDKSTLLKYVGTVFKESIGEFGESDVDDPYFYIRVTMLQIIMLNLLIAILSHTFDKVQSNNSAFDSKEKVELMIEEETLLTNNRKRGDKRYLHMVTKRDLDEANDEDQWEGKIKVLKDQIKSKFEKLEGSMKKQNEKFEKLEKNVVGKI